MANEQSKRQGQPGGQQQTAESGTMARTGDGGERGMAATTRQYQDPFSLLDTIFERMQRDFFGTSLLNALIPSQGGGGNGGTAVRVPRVQMRDTGDALELTAEMPGIEAPRVSVEIEDDVLTISGEASSQEERDDARVEQYVSFYRQIPLPEGIDTERAQASYRNGVLTIRFPKAAERSTARQIPVQTEQSGQPQGAGQRKQEKAA